jgi:Stress responsive A/B Barrel Domain
VTVQHVVLFNFPRPLSAADEAAMREMVASWPSEIALMSRCRLGTDLTGARNRGYTHLLYTEFEDVATLNRYRAHPAHVRFSDWVLERDCAVLAFDYHLDQGTVLMPEPRGLESAPEASGEAQREPRGRGAAWTEERGTSDEGRRRLKSAPEASGEAQPEPDPAART